MINDAGVVTNLLYQRFLPNQKPTNKNAARMIANCPISTPTLKLINAVTKAFSGIPKSAKTLANPNPCNKPNKNTSIKRLL